MPTPIAVSVSACGGAGDLSTLYIVLKPADDPDPQPAAEAGAEGALQPARSPSRSKSRALAPSRLRYLQQEIDSRVIKAGADVQSEQRRQRKKAGDMLMARSKQKQAQFERRTDQVRAGHTRCLPAAGAGAGAGAGCWVLPRCLRLLLPRAPRSLRSPVRAGACVRRGLRRGASGRARPAARSARRGRVRGRLDRRPDGAHAFSARARL